SGRRQFITKSKVQRQVVGNAPVVLPENSEQTVAQVFIAATTIALLDILRQAEQEIGYGITQSASCVPGKLTGEVELAGQTGIPGIQIIHDVVVSLKAEVPLMFSTVVEDGVLELPRSVVERLHQVIVANRPGKRSRALQTNPWKESIRNPGDAKCLRKIYARGIGK